MRGQLAPVASGLIVAAVPIVLVGNALLVLVNPWIVHAVYAMPGFPGDSIGLSDGERTDLAITGVRSIRPGDDGVELLRDARLPSGAPAFGEREVSHMQDVRDLVGKFVIAWGVALVVALGSSLALRRIGGPAPFRIPWSTTSRPIPRALVAGCYLTIAMMGLVGLVMLINFEFFFDGFHGIFFEGDSWRFKDRTTLRQIYPDFFWGVAGATIATLVAVQAAAVIGVVAWRSRHRSADGSPVPEAKQRD